MTTLVLVFKKMESKDKTNHDNFYSSSKAEIIINENEISQVFRINLYYNYNKHTKTFKERFWLNY